jgi:hypothetical protein
MMHFTPYVRRTADGIGNIIADRFYPASSPQAAVLARLEAGLGKGADAAAARLDEAEGWLWSERWLFASEDEMWRASRLRYASIETVSACNQSCFFCPVSVAPRPVERMKTALFETIIAGLAAIDTAEGVFLNNYNEPFLDTRLPSMVRAITRAGLKVAINTNAAVPFDPAKWRGARISLLTVNMHTLERERYRAERGSDDLPVVLENIALYAQHRVADDIRIVVLGQGDAAHDRATAEITARFADRGIATMPHLLMDRCGAVKTLPPVADRGAWLSGCEQTGSRVLEHIHVLADGRCVLCCEDYNEDHVIGDLRTQSIADVMGGDALVAHRKRIYGAAACEPGYICRACAYATVGEGTPVAVA